MDTSSQKPTVVPLFFDNYMSVIEKSAGTNMFRDWYCTVNGEKQNVTKNGDLSCALYVSSLLRMFGLVNETQITVHRAIAEMERCGWRAITEPKRGAVVVWDERETETGIQRKHIGFCLGNGNAISNRDEQGSPMIDKLDYRPILSYLWHTNLDGAA
jgi:hypothetical protein